MSRQSRGPWIAAAVVLVVLVAAFLAIMLSSHTSKPVARPTHPTVLPSTPSPTAPTTVPTSPSVSPTFSQPSPTGPDPRAIPVSRFVRPGAHKLSVQYQDLNGDGVDEVVLAEAANAAPAGGGPPTPFLDVWGFTGSQFVRIFDASMESPVAPPGSQFDAPDPMIDPSSGSQELNFVHLVDFRGDGRPDIVAGVTFLGAGVGPMEVWVFRMSGSSFVGDFFHTTHQGGVLTTDGDVEQLQTPFFHKNDPECCPSAIEHDTIGFNQSDGRIEILKQTFTKP